MNISFFNSIIVAPLTAIIGLYPYLSRRNEVTKYFALANCSLALWNVAEIFTMLPVSYTTALFMFRLSYVAGILLVPFFFRFIFAFMEIEITQIKRLWVGVIAVAVLLIPFAFTRFLVAGIAPDQGLPLKEYHGAVYPIFVTYLLGALGYALYRFFRMFKFSVGQKRMQCKYLFTALCVAFIEAVFFFISTCFFNLPTYYYYMQVIYVLLISYAIVTHKLMDINIIIRKTVIYSMTTGILTAMIVFAASIFSKLSESYLGHGTLFASVLAACFITAVFHPIQLFVQRFVDRHFFSGWADREGIREVAAGFSHELKSPLAGLSMQAQLALMEIEDLEKGKGSLRQALPKIKKELNYILSQAMDAARRIEAVRGVAEPVLGQMESIDIQSVLESSVGIMSKRAGEAGVTVRQEIPRDLSAVRSNGKQLEIVFINLIKNALDAMDTAETGSGRNGETGKLLLSAHERNGSVFISVKDTGPGIADKDVERIFEPYYTTKGRKGTGMGLYLTHQIVKAHGGLIEVKSELGRGTEFIVKLPRFSAEEGAAA